MVVLVGRQPLCACCQQRHPIGQASAYLDMPDQIWRCSRCDRPIDVDGECGTPLCCGRPR